MGNFDRFTAAAKAAALFCLMCALLAGCGGSSATDSSLPQSTDMAEMDIAEADISMPIMEATPVLELDLSQSAGDNLSILKDYPQLERLSLNGLGLENVLSAADCTQLKWLDLRGNPVSLEAYEQIAAALPDCEIIWDVPLGSASYDCTVTELILPDLGAGAPETLRYFSALDRVDLRGKIYTLDEMNAFQGACPDARFLFTFLLADVEANSHTAQLDISGHTVDDIEEFRGYLHFLPELTYLDMSDCGVSNEDMARLQEDFPTVRFVWTVHMQTWSLRTDTVAFSTLNSTNSPVRLTSKDIEVLKYCTDLQALDLGHHEITDISVLANLPQLRVLILADNQISDIRPLAQLKELRYLELFINFHISSLEPLRGLENLMDLNMSCVVDVEDYSPLYSLPNLERLWINQISIPGDILRELLENLPEGCQLCYGLDDATSGGWRRHERYNVEFDMFRNNYIDPVFLENP